jgi:hypothetical protein
MSDDATAEFARTLAAEIDEARDDPSVDLPTALDGYVRQYTGELRGGRRVVYVNLLCASFVEHLPGELTQMMTVNDGGECNCGAVFDPETSEMLDFDCAGDA